MGFFSRISDYIKSIFFQGFFALLPITLTIAFLHFSINLMRRWLEPVLQFMPTWLLVVPFVEIIAVFSLILVVGFFLNHFFINELIEYLEGLISRIPLVKQVYVGFKQLVSALSAQDQGAFKEIVLVEFPRNGSYAVGFLTGQIPEELRPRQDVRYYNVFIPASPNPTSGFFIIVPENDFIIVDMTRQEAMKLIISGGIILPDRFKKP